MNTVTVSLFKRPFHTRLCLESLCRAQRWSRGWANLIAVCIPVNALESVRNESLGVIDRNPDIPWEVWSEPAHIQDPHAASKWMLDTAFNYGGGSDINLYVEDDVIVSPDAFLLCKYVEQKCGDGRIAGVCLYHETIPEHYLVAPPDKYRLHFVNGLNTCGGTAFLRYPYLRVFQPNWNCKQVLPTGFDYSAHFLMYLHKLYMVYPDLSRSMNIGWSGGSLSQEQWARYCGRSIWAQTADSLSSWDQFKLEGEYPPVVLEEWMKDELKHRGD